jgi:hypothetical protein
LIFFFISEYILLQFSFDHEPVCLLSQLLSVEEGMSTDQGTLPAGFFVFFSAVQNMQITLLILLARTCLSGSFIILNLYMAMLYPASMRHLSPLYADSAPCKQNSFSKCSQRYTVKKG